MKGSSTPAPLSQDIILKHRQTLADDLQSLTDSFLAGEPIDRIVHARSCAVDQILVEIWQHYFGDCEDEVALVAVGGYGRAELLPKSDVDMMILLPNKSLDKYRNRIEPMITQLWDLKLEIGHSVRSCKECRTEASKDVTVVTNLMESRLLAGSKELHSKMRAEIAASKIWSKRDFFKAKLEEQAKRHSKFDETAYRLEPNIKEGPGGLRDFQTIFWVAKRYFDVEKLEDLTRLGFLIEHELTALRNGRNLLWRIRFALHTIAKRREDRLLFEHQNEIARLFRYQDEDNNLAVEQLMQQYYRAVTGLERLNEMLLQLLQEAIENPGAKKRAVVINKRFESVHGFLQVREENVFQQYPPALLEVFLVMQQHPELKGVRAQTIRLIRNHRYLIDQSFRDDLITRDLFMSILREPLGVSHELRRMNRYGVLAAYIPEFSNIVGRMQYDLFHIYTVDLHTLFMLRNIRRFSVPEHADWQPTCTKIFPTLERPEILYVATLFHDIAKGRGGDHSELGAVDAEKFCKNHGLNRDSTNMVTWLVRNHLVMSMTAQRKDISDPDIINEFARKVGDQRTLDYIYLMTVADISATNPELLTAWRSRLLLELYLRTKYVFRHGLTKPMDADTRTQERRHDAEQILLGKGLSSKQCQQIWQGFSDDYFLRHNGEEIAWHTEAIAKTPKDQLPLILVNDQITRGTTPIFIYAQDNDGFFGIVTALLTRLGLNIVDARIISSGGEYTLDTYLVLDENNQPIQDAERIEDILNLIGKGIRQPDRFPKTTQRPLPRQLKHFNAPARITAEQSNDGHHTLLEVIACDRPGLLATIGKVFFDYQIRVHNAKISTLGENAENIFLISDTHNQPITDKTLLDELVATLSESIDQAVDTSATGRYVI